MEFVVLLTSSAVAAESTALHYALSLRREGDTVTVVCMGSPKAETMLRSCTVCGAESAFLLTDPDFSGSDTHAVSRILRAFVDKHCTGEYLILAQESGSLSPTNAVPGRLAGLLGSQQFYYVTSIERGPAGIRCTQDYGDEIRTCAVPAGSVVFLRNTPVLNRASFPESEVTVMNRVDLGLGRYSVGSSGSRTALVTPREAV